MNGISSSRNALIGLPALAASSCAISSALASSASAMRISASARSPGVVLPQVSNAPRAALTARSTSALVDDGAWAISSPVAGLSTASVAPSAASTDSPSMKFFSACVAVAIASVSSPRCRSAQRSTALGADRAQIGGGTQPPRRR